MASEPFSAAPMARHPVHEMLSAFPFVCFIGALLTDLAYASTYDMMWANFSIWLLTAGLAMGVLAALAGILASRRSRERAQRPAWPHAIGSIVALVLALFNAFVHSRDGYTSVVPAGLTLSVLTVVILIASSWLGGSLVYHRRVRVAN